MENPPAPQTQHITQLDYLRGFKFLFEDENGWWNLLMGALLMIIPFVGPIVLMGWQMVVFHNLVKGQEKPIPRFDFNDFVNYLTKGIIPFVVSLILMIPFLFIIFSLGFGGGIGIPLMAAEGLPTELVVILVILLLMAILFLGFIPLVVFSMAALTRAYLTEDIGEALSLGKLWAYGSATWKRIVLAYLVYMPIMFGLMLVGMLLLYIGMYPAMVLMNFAWLYMTWQIYDLYLGEGGEEIPLKAPPPAAG